MDFEQFASSTQDAITGRKVFSEPYTSDGVTVITASRVWGGGGGGTGQDDDGQQGEGGGFGLHARPAGAYVIRDGVVSWRPALDPNTAIRAVAAVVVSVIVGRALVSLARGR